MKTELGAGLCLLALIVLPGCSSDSSGVLEPDTTEAAAEQLTAAVIVPTLDALNRFTLDALISGPHPGILGDGCAALDAVCSTGTLELCFSAGGQSYDFDSCTASSAGVLLDGVITEAQGVMTYNVAMDGVVYAGSFDLTYAGDCVTESPFGFSVTSAGYASTLSGSLTYCDNETRPDGTATFLVDGSAGSWTIALTMDHSDSAAALITNVSAQTTESCTIDLGTGQASCD